MSPSSPHDHAEEWSAAALAGDLTEAEAHAWKEHLQTCPDCQKLNVEELAMAKLIEETLQSETPDAGFEQRLLSRLHETRVGEGNRWYEFFLFHPALTLAGASLLLLAGASVGWLARSASGAQAIPPAALAKTNVMPPTAPAATPEPQLPTPELLPPAATEKNSIAEKEATPPEAMPALASPPGSPEPKTAGPAKAAEQPAFPTTALAALAAANSEAALPTAFDGMKTTLPAGELSHHRHHHRHHRRHHHHSHHPHPAAVHPAPPVP